MLHSKTIEIIYVKEGVKMIFDILSDSNDTLIPFWGTGNSGKENGPDRKGLPRVTLKYEKQNLHSIIKK